MKIESEEKREALQGIITRWAEHTKVMPYLRSFDIPSLVSNILGEFYHVHLSCGHWVSSMDEGVHIAFKEFSDGEGEEYEASGIYCKACAEDFKKNWGAWEVK